MTHADLKEAAEKATPGPWRRGNLGYGIFQDKHAGDEQAMLCRCPVDKEIMPAQWSRDAAFIALANPTRILSLIEENERMREALTPFAEFNTKIDAHPDAAKTPDDYCIHDGLKVGDFRRAFSVIKDKP